MTNRVVYGFVFCTVGFCLVPLSAHAGETFSGGYQAANLSIEIVPDGGGYTGEIHLGPQRFSFKAREESGRLQGAFTSQGNNFDFLATREGEGLTLVTGGATYALKRIPLPVNPLAHPAPTNPLSPREPPAHSGAPLADYNVVTTTDFGKALSAHKPGVTSVQAALEATFPDLARYFDGRPAFSGAFEDSQSHQSGGASFTARLRGGPVKGFVSCKLGGQGATVAVIYCQADAPPAEWEKLTGAAADRNAAPQIKLRQYNFPDGTGSVGLADGWQTSAPSCLQGVVIQGPADQVLTIGFCVSVVTPDSMAVQTQRQLEINARQWGMQPPPPLQLLVAPLTGPVEALINLGPQLSQFSRRNNGPAIKFENIALMQNTKANVPGGRAALLTYSLIKSGNGGVKHYRALAQVETDPLGPGGWMFYAVEAAAPAQTFDQDLPVMMSMLYSLQTNNQVVQQKTRQNIDASNQRFAALQGAHRQLMDSYDQQNRAWERRQTVQSRSNADFDEVIRGYRTVQDTQTGEKSSVDLGNVHDIVTKLNQFDPGRYKEIPLRDER